MSDSKLREMSMNFSVQIVSLVKDLRAMRETIIANQIGRSGTSIGANIYEANYAQGRKDFISKLEIALKEASETGYWLELLYRTGYLDEEAYKVLNDQCTAIRVMLIASCRTAKTATGQIDFPMIFQREPPFQQGRKVRLQGRAQQIPAVLPQVFLMTPPQIPTAAVLKNSTVYYIIL